LYDKNGVLYLGDGSWGKLRSLKKPEERPYLATYGDSYHVRCIASKGISAITSRSVPQAASRISMRPTASVSHGVAKKDSLAPVLRGEG